HNDDRNNTGRSGVADGLLRESLHQSAKPPSSASSTTAASNTAFTPIVNSSHDGRQSNNTSDGVDLRRASAPVPSTTSATSANFTQHGFPQNLSSFLSQLQSPATATTPSGSSTAATPTATSTTSRTFH